MLDTILLIAIFTALFAITLILKNGFNEIIKAMEVINERLKKAGEKNQ